MRCAWTTLLTSIVTVLCADVPVAADDWAQWRGPRRDGISNEKNWQTVFPDSGPRILWKRSNIGIGYSGISVSNGKLYTMGWADGMSTLFCLDVNNGQTLWSASYKSEKFAIANPGGPGSTPVIDRDRVYSLGGGGQLLCHRADSGTLIWTKQVTSELDVKVPTWGFSGSPVIVDNMLLIDLGRIVALDKNSGTLIWRTQDYGASYSTPRPFAIKGSTYIAVFPKMGLYVLDMTGQELASFDWTTKYDVNAATPIVKGNRFFISSGYGTGGAMLRWEPDGLKEQWRNREMRNQMDTCILIDGYLYGFDEAILKCLDFESGQRMWQKRGLGKGSIAAANGKLIFLSQDGELGIAQATPDAYRQLALGKVLDGGTYWTVPVLANGRIYCRNSIGHLACVDVKTYSSQ